MEGIVTNLVGAYLDDREKEWKRIIHIQRLWNWTFAVLFTLMLLTLAFVAKSFKELNDAQRDEINYQHSVTAEKQKRDAEIAKEYRDNMNYWKNADGKK
jgi:hypothetical protein